MDKKASQRIHAKRRAFQRYGLVFTKAVRNDVKARIKNNKGKFLYRQSRRISVWQIDYDNKQLKVVYDTLRGEIVTFLPLDEITNGNEEYKVV